EFEAQRQWAELDDRLTFIILSKDRLASFENSPASNVNDFGNMEVDSMIGDVNLFLHPIDTSTVGANNECFEGELSVMIAEPDMRGRGLASEALAALLEFSGHHLPSKLSGLVAKVSLDNLSSIKLFSSHLKFIERKRCSVFNQASFD
ncbi:Acyl-CoA N-acyltransferase, partial [Paragonimus heterotremus]